MSNEKKAIENTLQYFFDGIDGLNIDLVRKALHPEARSFYVTEDGTVGGLLYSEWEAYLENVKNTPDHPLCRSKSIKKIIYIDVIGTAASAKAELIFEDCTFVDYYNLLKVDNRWYIVNTTFHAVGFDPIP